MVARIEFEIERRKDQILFHFQKKISIQLKKRKTIPDVNQFLQQ